MICTLWFPEHDEWPTVNVAGTNLDNIKSLGCFFFKAFSVLHSLGLFTGS